jgi:glutathione S-transferase
MSKPTLYGPALSTYVRSARLALEEKGVDYNLVEIDFLQGPMPAEQIERQPFARVPAFEHDGFQLYETTAICRYVDEAFDGPSLQPGTAQERARMNQIISILDSYTYPCTVGILVIQRLVMPMLGNQPDEATITEALPEIGNCMNTLAALRGNNTYLAGNQLSLADLHFAPIYDYFRNTPESEPILEKNPGLVDWWKEMSGRASLQNTPPLPG